jgi:hypothetical protein
MLSFRPIGSKLLTIFLLILTLAIEVTLADQTPDLLGNQWLEETGKSESSA